MASALERLRLRQMDYCNLDRVISVLEWDEQVLMPPAGANARGRQLATVGKLSHEIQTAADLGELIEQAAAETSGLPDTSDEASLVRVARRDYEHASRLPSSLVADLARHRVAAFEAWSLARQANDFALFSPHLANTIDLSRRMAEHLGYQEHPYDALLDIHEPDMKASDIRDIFADLKRDLVPLIRRIASSEETVDDSLLRLTYDIERQKAFGEMLATEIGFDFSRGRQDVAVHPFQTTFSRDDVRITTRYNSNDLIDALFSTLHEAGHGLYELGSAPELEQTILAGGSSSGVHESQSRLWENVVGRSLPFWSRFYPSLKNAFPDALQGVDVERFYRAINKVQPSLIRVDADEVTYNLHVLLRFEMEMDFLEGSYPLTDAPEVWNEKMEAYLGIRPTNDTLGILQDIHWTGTLGSFPSYTIGNILALQLYDHAQLDLPDLASQIARGQFDSLRSWLTDRVYRHGRKFSPKELIFRVTGEPLQTRSYMSYLHEKFGAMYRL
jgi:carboxypeptidase Taq